MKKNFIILFFIVLLFLAIKYELPEYFHHGSEQEHLSGAYQALNFFSFQRAYPNNSIPDVSHYAAFEYSRNMFDNSNKTNFDTDPWHTIGPHNLGGRTLAVAFNPQNPNTIYAGSASGGLWRSKTGGIGTYAWEYVPTGYPVLAVSYIEFAPEDSNTIYIGTGEVYHYQQAGTGAAFRNTRGTYGIGILKSTDGGQTWSKSLDWSFHQMRGVWVVKVNPLNPNTVWAGTTEGVYKSTDAGASWTQVHDVIMVNDLVINPVDTNIVIIGCGNFASTGFGIYRTADSGNSWTKISSNLPSYFEGKILLDIYKRSPNIVYASIGNGFLTSINGASWLCRSEDSGLTWTVMSQVDYSQHQGWFSHDVAVNPQDSTEVIAIGIEVYKSTNSGTNLVQKSTTTWYTGRILPGDPEGPPTYSHVDHHDVVYHPTDPNIIYFGNDGGVFRSIDGGNTFQTCNGGYQTGQFYNGFSSSITDSLLSMGGFQDNATAIYDGQLAWIVRLIGGDGSWTAIDPTNANIIYGSAQNLYVRKSTNQGQNWSSLSIPSSSIAAFIAPFVVGYDNPQIIYAGNDKIFKSVNGGLNWTTTNAGNTLDGNPAIAMAISYQNSNVVYVATAPYTSARGVFRTLNGGSSWTNISATLPDRFPADLTVDPTNDANAYVTFSGYGTSHIFKTNDYGITWQDINNGLPDVPTNAVIVDPLYTDHIYIGNDLGVYVSLDGGSSWSEYQDGLPGAVMVFDLSISPLNRKLRAATHGNGAYERDLIGETVNITSSAPVPGEFQLKQNYPNPFNPNTTIEFYLPQGSQVSLQIYNNLGQKVRTLMVNEYKTAGSYKIIWNGKNDAGNQLATGIYVCQLKAGDFLQRRTMILSK